MYGNLFCLAVARMANKGALIIAQASYNDSSLDMGGTVLISSSIY